MKHLFVRNIFARRLFDTFFVLAAVTVLATRAFLFLAGWPSITGGSLHIAHMLWGGVFMIAAFIFLFGFLDKRAYNFAAIFGGIGFGLFIDEVGKFVTKNNDYFFQPTFTIIYLVFVALYFIIRELDSKVPLTKVERTVNALEISKEIFLNHLDEGERKELLNLIANNSAHSKLFQTLLAELKEADAVPVGRVEQWLITCKLWYLKIIEKSLTLKFILVLLFLQGVLFGLSFFGYWGDAKNSTIEQWIVVMGVCFAIVSLIYIVFGAFQMFSNRFEAYRKFYRANLLAIFLIQPFAFYVATFIPVMALLINLLCLFSLQYLIVQEQKKLVDVS